MQQEAPLSLMTEIPEPTKSESTKTIGAIVLAAGFSNRFGSSKLLAKLDNGKTVFQQTLEHVKDAIPDVLIVSRIELTAENSFSDDKILLFDNAEQGMGSTLSFAAAHMPKWDACLVCLADMPFIKSDTYRSIAAQVNEDRIVIPSFQSKAGNPVAFGKNYFEQLKQLQGDSGGKAIIRDHQSAVVDLAVEDAGILQDVDTPIDLSRYQSSE